MSGEFDGHDFSSKTTSDQPGSAGRTASWTVVGLREAVERDRETGWIT